MAAASRGPSLLALAPTVFFYLNLNGARRHVNAGGESCRSPAAGVKQVANVAGQSDRSYSCLILSSLTITFVLHLLRSAETCKPCTPKACSSSW